MSALSLSLAPLMYAIKFSRPHARESGKEFTATLLAHHVLEKIMAQRRASPDTLPLMATEAPVVVTSEGVRAVSEYFRPLLGNALGLQESDNPELHRALKPFTCRVDTYYLDDFLYKVIVYIGFEESGRKKRVFLEQLLPHHPSFSRAEPQDVGPSLPAPETERPADLPREDPAEAGQCHSVPFSPRAAAPASDSIIDASHELFEFLRSDFRTATAVRFTPHTLHLTTPSGLPVTYTIRDGDLVRQAPRDPPRAILSGLRAGGFAGTQANPYLVNVWLIHEDAPAPVFFTSFALRGGIW